MRKPSKLQLAKDRIFATLDKAPQKVFNRTELSTLLRIKRHEWGLPDSIYVSRLIEFLKQDGRLAIETFSSTEYKGKSVFTWGQVTDYQLAASIRPSAYLSHWTAVFLHGLTEQLPQTIYVNKEQSEKYRDKEYTLEQQAIDRAFGNLPRVSKYMFEFRNRRLCLLSGKHTNRLEVGEIKGPDGELLPVTKLERTLIDISVRPQYAGGVHEVLAAFQSAKGRASSNVLLATLKRLDYAYPYHQAIGFYMSRAGYPESSIKLFRDIGMRFDFYLANRIPDKEYVQEWRLHIPKGL